MTAHRPAQIMRLSATVLAGAASLCLTVAAGAYIVNHMPELAAPSAGEDNAAAASPDHGDHLPATAGGSPLFTTGVVELAMSTELSTPTVERAAASAPASAATTLERRRSDAALAGRLRVGGTYVDAEVAPPRTDTVAFTVDTNAIDVAAKYLGIADERVGVTALHAELDTRRGDVVFVLSDPTLGSHTLRIEPAKPRESELTGGEEATATQARSLTDQERATVAV